MIKSSDMLSRRRVLGTFAMGGLAASGALPVGAAMAAPSADLWDHWQPSGAGLPGDGVDNTAWDGILARYRTLAHDGVARFAYGTVSAEDRKILVGYIQALERADWRNMSRPQQFAFWVNLYNAVTVRTILEHYPVDGIRDIGGGLFSPGPWDDERIKIDGEDVTLNDVEHRILRPIWKDSRIHFVVNCASIGCPNLPARAMSPGASENSLQQAALDFVNHPRGVRVEQGSLNVSSIFIWYRADFGEQEAKILSYLRRYAKPGLVDALTGISGIDDDSYDWALNEPSGG